MSPETLAKTVAARAIRERVADALDPAAHAGGQP